MAMSTASGKLSTKMIRHFTNKTVSQKITKWTKQVSNTSKKVKSTQSRIDNYQTQLDKANDTLNKKNGYKSANDAYRSLIKDIEAKEKQLAKAKTSATKKKLTADLKKLKDDKKATYKRMISLTNSKDVKKAQETMVSANKKLTALNKSLKGLKASKKKYSSYLAMYKKVKKERAAAAKKAKQNKNAKAIKKKIEANQKDKRPIGHTAIYRADKMEDTVWFLGDVDNSETDTNDIASNPVDKGDPRSRYSRRSEKSLTGTFYLFGAGEKDVDSKFNDFQKWQRYGLELEVRGFSKLAHVRISDITKNKFYRNGLQMTITFKYVLPQNILEKKKKHSKGSRRNTSKGKQPTRKGTGGSQTAKRYVTTKAGLNTYAEIAKKTGVSIKSLMKLNKYPNSGIPQGTRVRYK
ncbi:hypothetical protein [Secundilactobacillus kimchicus]|uniref:hypothetical protein n=1 Tax=Secundilactobacillus kimchicus TaxID=528209 RepID=UPI0024AA014B|nr:hypothetical protein [Secundilactobacillus kimchicus]